MADAPTAATIATGGPGRAGPSSLAATGSALQGAIGVAAVIGLWEAAGRGGWLGRTFPALSAVLDTVLSDARGPVLGSALRATATAAATGLAVGVAVAMAAAVAAVVVPALKPGLDRLAALLHALPLIALAPLFIVTLGRDRTAAAIAAMGAAFAMFVAATSALDAARPLHHDLFTVLGADRHSRLRRLQLPAAVPGLIDGLRLAAPAAVLGAVLGEWFGAPRGLGVLIVSAMQNFQIELLWAAALLAALVSMVAYGALSLLATVASRRWGGAS